jgi:hypothetical protein
VGRLEAVISIQFSGSYKGEFILEFKRFFREVRQTDVVQEFNVSAVVIDCNCKECQ